ncbi:MAG: class I SAM-dependent methyltransferase [Deltaproteobacteria bacterium]|nr:class I SAM-dependent methyltransferase [Deltaproteobacteria bacterium]
MEMVRKACQKPRALQDAVLQADVHHIPFRDEMFDSASCN